MIFTANPVTRTTSYIVVPIFSFKINRCTHFLYFLLIFNLYITNTSPAKWLFNFTTKSLLANTSPTRILWQYVFSFLVNFAIVDACSWIVKGSLNYTNEKKRGKFNFFNYTAYCKFHELNSMHPRNICDNSPVSVNLTIPDNLRWHNGIPYHFLTILTPFK